MNGRMSVDPTYNCCNCAIHHIIHVCLVAASIQVVRYKHEVSQHDNCLFFDGDGGGCYRAIPHVLLTLDKTNA